MDARPLSIGTLALALVACQPPAQDPSIIYHPNVRGAPVAAGAHLDTRETVDAGNDPTVAGCQDVYATQNAMCGNMLDRWGDWCSSPTHIMERVVGRMCTNQAQPVPVEFDCRVVLNDPNARCEVVPDHCPPGNLWGDQTSAMCVIGVVG